MTLSQLRFARIAIRDHAWMLSLAVAARCPGSLAIAVDRLAKELGPAGGSGVCV